MGFVPLVVLLAATAAPAAPPSPAPSAGSEMVRFERFDHRDRLEADGTLERTTELEVVLRDAAAVAAFGQIGIPYAEGLAEVRFEKVAIVKSDGRRVEVENGLVEDLNPFGVSGSSVSADVRVRKLTIPGLEPGDRLSYRIAITQKPLVPGRVFGERKFVGIVGDPVQAFELDLPRSAGVAVELDEGLGASWEEVPAAADRIVRRLAVKAKRPDFGTDGPTEKQIEALARPDVVYSNFGSWSEVAEWWWDLSRDRLAPDDAVRKEAAALVAGKKTAREKIEALHAFVATRVRYLNVNFGIGRMQPRRASEVLANRYGDCKDKVALLAALAASAGLDVRPVLLHSQRPTLQDRVPEPQQFDHMVALVQLGPKPEDQLWLDATNDLGPPGYLLPALRDTAGLLVEKTGKGRVVRTPEHAPFRQRAEVELDGALGADGTLRARVRWTLRSDGELSARQAFRVTPGDRHAELVEKSFASGWKEVTVSNVTTSDPSSLAEPFRIEFDAETVPAERSTDGEWPLTLPLPDFKLPVPRKVADDGKVARFELEEFDARAQIRLPEGVQARPPVAVTLERPFARLQSEYAVAPGTLTARRRLTLPVRSVSTAESATYDAFRAMVEKDGQQAFVLDPRGATGLAAPSAAALLKSGRDAYARKDYEKAVEALGKAVALDATLKDAYLHLGQALRDAGRNEEALKAFTRQVEIDPFHESAYAERAYVHMQRDEDTAAERELLKQIEVAPLKAWSHEKLADVRMGQRRYEEAARHYASAASIEPKEAKTWANLGMAYAMAKKPAEARAALDKALTLGPSDWVTVRVAAGLDRLGATEAAAAAARSAVPRLAARLDALTAAEFDEDDLYWARQLMGAWYLIGKAARVAGDLATAERYLAAVWNTAFVPEAGWELGLVREKQGRLADAARQWATADSMSGWRRPPDVDARLMSVSPALPDGPDTLTEMRTVRLGEVSADEFTTAVALLVGRNGAVVGARSLSAKDSAAFDRARPQLLAARIPFTSPGDEAAQIVVRGLLACTRLSGCSLLLDRRDTEPNP